MGRGLVHIPASSIRSRHPEAPGEAGPRKSALADSRIKNADLGQTRDRVDARPMRRNKRASGTARAVALRGSRQKARAPQGDGRKFERSDGNATEYFSRRSLGGDARDADDHPNRADRPPD